MSNMQSTPSAGPFALLSELDAGWEPARSVVRGPTRPWDDRRVLVEPTEPRQPLPPPSAVRGGTRSWDELLALTAEPEPARPAPSSPTRLGTLEWAPAIFDTWRSALESAELERALPSEAELPPIVADHFDDLGVDDALLAFVDGPPPSRRAQKPELAGFAIPWAADAPTIEIRGCSDMDPGELSILLGLEE